MTESIQVADRHLGILYKRVVYCRMRQEMMKRLSEARKAAGGAEGVTVKALTPCEKRIVITKAIADEHERFTKIMAYWHGFIATATWMPV